MYKTKGRFVGTGHISFDADEDETPLTQRDNHEADWSSEAMTSHLEAYCQGARHHTHHQGTRPKQQQMQRRSRRSALSASWCEDQPLTAFSRVGHMPASQKRRQWSTTWYMQISAVVVALAVAALIGLMFALRHVDKMRDAGRGLEVDSDDAAGENGTNANATRPERVAVDEDGDAAFSPRNGSKREDPESESRLVSGYTPSRSVRSSTSVYNSLFSSISHQQSMQEASSLNKSTESVKTRILVRLNRKEWLNSRGWHLT